MSKVANEELWPGIDSRFLLVIVAALRNKQLLRGPNLVSNQIQQNLERSNCPGRIKHGWSSSPFLNLNKVAWASRPVAWASAHVVTPTRIDRLNLQRMSRV